MKSSDAGSVGGTGGSPPSRGAWIEIKLLKLLSCDAARVAPLAGGVD